MKRGGALVLVVLAIAAFFYFGGEAEGPSETPDITAPGVNETAGGIREFFTNIANAVSGWNQGTWRIVAVFVCAGILWWVFKKVPLVVWLVIALVGAIIAVQV